MCSGWGRGIRLGSAGLAGGQAGGRIGGRTGKREKIESFLAVSNGEGVGIIQSHIFRD